MPLGAEVVFWAKAGERESASASSTRWEATSLKHKAARKLQAPTFKPDVRRRTIGVWHLQFRCGFRLGAWGFKVSPGLARLCFWIAGLPGVIDRVYRIGINFPLGFEGAKGRHTLIEKAECRM